VADRGLVSAEAPCAAAIAALPRLRDRWRVAAVLAGLRAVGATRAARFDGPRNAVVRTRVLSVGAFMVSGHAARNLVMRARPERRRDVMLVEDTWDAGRDQQSR